MLSQEGHLSILKKSQQRRIKAREEEGEKRKVASKTWSRISSLLTFCCLLSFSLSFSATDFSLLVGVIAIFATLSSIFLLPSLESPRFLYMQRNDEEKARQGTATRVWPYGLTSRTSGSKGGSGLPFRSAAVGGSFQM